jgi:transcriptional regulator with XRE-family HTH domain
MKKKKTSQCLSNEYATEKNVESLITQLEDHRLEHKIPQQEIADKLGVAFSTVNRWFNRKAKPNKIQIYHIQKLLGKKGK